MHGYLDHVSTREPSGVTPEEPLLLTERVQTDPQTRTDFEPVSRYGQEGILKGGMPQVSELPQVT